MKVTREELVGVSIILLIVLGCGTMSMLGGIWWLRLPIWISAVMGYGGWAFLVLLMTHME